MAETTSTSLSALTANAKRLRSIYGWLAFGGLAACALLGLVLSRGATVEGPLIAGAVLALGVLAMGSAMLLWRRVLDGKIHRLLLAEPDRIARVFPKRTESAVHGATVASYSWIVLELSDGTRMDVYASPDDVATVVAEIRRCAPRATYDSAWVTERLNVHLR